MKTKYYFLAALAAVSLVSCSSDDFIADAPPADNSQEYGVPIMFSSLKKGMTRADFEGADAAALLNNKFVVSGYKGSKTAWQATAIAAQGDDPATLASTMVFDNYIVTYTPNTAHTTESNSDNWEYVGNEPIDHAKTNGIVKQTIKYWDYNTDQYDFFAWAVGEGINPVFSGTPVYTSHQVLITAIDPENAVQTETSAGEGKMAYSFTGTAADLTNCYISDIVTVNKTGNAGVGEVTGYNQPVTLKFRQLGAKVRMGIYETVPGYSVKNVKFYEAAKSTNVDDLGDEDPTLFTTTAGEIYNQGTYYIYFPTVDQPTKADNNQAHIKFKGEVGDQVSNVDFNGLQYTIAELGEKGDNGKMDIYLGRSSNTASMAGRAEGNYYTQYLPNESGTNLNLRVNYTLEAIDGSGEIIEVKGATAQVPAIYTQWKAGYAYTYLFKISDKTNGYTGVYDPTNPDGNTTDSNPAGLYPITFDAVVVNAEDDKTQETITTVSMPSITTYQQNSTVVNKNEYEAATGDIYVTVNDGVAEGTNPALANGKLVTFAASGSDGMANLYRVANGTTEALVVDALQIRNDDPSTAGNVVGRNGLELVKTDDQTDKMTFTNKVEFGVDGNAISVGDNQAAKFSPKANTTYAFVYFKKALTSTTPIYQPAAFTAIQGTKYRFAYKAAGTGDVKKDEVYFANETDGKKTVYLGQDVSKAYTRSGAGTTADPYVYTPASGYAVTGTTYYYTLDHGQNYIEYTKLAYADFKTKGYVSTGSGYDNPDTDSPADDTNYYTKDNSDNYHLCIIYPEQKDNLSVLDTNTYVQVPAAETAAVNGMTYFDKYIKNNGEYYAKVIKVQ